MAILIPMTADHDIYTALRVRIEELTLKQQELRSEVSHVDDQLAAIKSELETIRPPILPAIKSAAKIDRRTRAETEQVVLNFLQAQPEGAGIREISRKCNLPYTSTHSAIQHLNGTNAIVQDGNRWRSKA
jgi:predicted transcriptional regulator